MVQRASSLQPADSGIGLTSADGWIVALAGIEDRRQRAPVARRDRPGTADEDGDQDQRRRPVPQQVTCEPPRFPRRRVTTPCEIGFVRALSIAAFVLLIPTRNHSAPHSVPNPRRRRPTLAAHDGMHRPGCAWAAPDRPAGGVRDDPPARPRASPPGRRPRRSEGPVTCAACGCRLSMNGDAWFHFNPLGGRDARGCRVDCADAAHDASGSPDLGRRLTASPSARGRAARARPPRSSSTTIR